MPGGNSHSSSPSASLAKSKLRLSQASDPRQWGEPSSYDKTLGHHVTKSIAGFPTTNHPVLDTTLKDMLTSLQCSIHADIFSIVKHFKSELTDLGDRVTNIESEIGEITTSFNDMVDANGNREEDIEWMKANLADLEDRSRRNNVKIRGIPESVQPSVLKEYFTHKSGNLPFRYTV